MSVLNSLSFRLTMFYVALFCLSVSVLMGLYYWVSVLEPTKEIEAQVDREARELAQLYIVDGQQALVAALQRREAAIADRMPFHAFIDKEGQVVTANLPSWPRTPSTDWVEIEADIYRDGDESD